MHTLAQLCVRRPVFATMLVMSLVVVGIFCYFTLGAELFPQVDLPTVLVIIANPGAAPEEIDAEREVAENANHHQGHDQHGGEHGAPDAELGECMHGLPCLNLDAVEEPGLPADGYRLVAAESVDDADLIAIHFADDDYAEVGGIVIDSEDLVGIGGPVPGHGG